MRLGLVNLYSLGACANDGARSCIVFSFDDRVIDGQCALSSRGSRYFIQNMDFNTSSNDDNDDDDDVLVINNNICLSLPDLRQRYKSLNLLYVFIVDVADRMFFFSSEIKEKVFFNCFNVIRDRWTDTGRNEKDDANDEIIRGFFIQQPVHLKRAAAHLGSVRPPSVKCREILFLSFCDVLAREGFARLPSDVAYYCELPAKKTLKITSRSATVAAPATTTINNGSAWRPSKMITSAAAHLGIPPSLLDAVSELLKTMEVSSYGKHPDTLMAAAIYAVVVAIRREESFINEKEKDACARCLGPANRYFGCFLFQFFGKCKATVARVPVPSFHFETDADGRRRLVLNAYSSASLASDQM